MSRRIALLAAAVVASSLAPAASWAQKKSRPTIAGSAPFQRGDRADVYTDVAHPRFPGHSVAKVVRPGGWFRERFHFRDAGTLKAYGALVQRSTRALHRDPAAGALFRRIVPTVRVDASLPGWLFMTPRTGVALEQLSPPLRKVARGEMRKTLGEATRILGPDLVNRSPDNFLFDAASGHITGWVSIVQQPRGKAFPYRRRRVLGDGINTIAYEIENRAPGQHHLTVLKQMWPYSPKRAPMIATEADQRDLAYDIVYSARELVPRLEAELGMSVIAESITLEDAPGIVLQEMAGGVAIDQLAPALRARAEGLARRAMSVAQAALPRATFSAQLSARHFHFDRKTGDPQWFDWLADKGHKYGLKGRKIRPPGWRP
ncbi:MAG TPA: hypothetical protein VFU21_20215 [Kofleriaceae bacterium]|nr:hypothetical protein [Kofleriaceae bacterium]